MAAAAPGAPGAFSTFANAAAPRPAPRRRSSARPRRLRARPALLSSLPPMAFRARGRRPPLPPLLLLLLWVTGQAAPVAGLGLGSDTEPQIERRFVPDECPRTVRSGDFVRYHYVGTFPDGQKFDSRYRSPRGRPASALPLSGQAFRARRTSPSPAPRASRSSLPPAQGSPTLNPAAPGASVRALRLPGSSHAGLGSRRSPCVAESGRGTRSQRTDKGGIDGRWPRRGGPRARGRCWGSPAASLNRAVPRAPSLDRPGRRCRSRRKQLPRCRSDFGVPAWF